MPDYSSFIATTILINPHSCNQRFCNTHILSYCTNKKKVMSHNTKKDRYPFNLKLVHIWLLKTIKQSQQLRLTILCAQQKKAVSGDDKRKTPIFSYITVLVKFIYVECYNIEGKHQFWLNNIKECKFPAMLH